MNVRPDRTTVHTFKVPTDTKPTRLDQFLATLSELNLSRTSIQKLINSGKVLIDGKAVTSRYILRGYETIVVETQEALPSILTAEDLPLTIAYEDEHLLVIDKPAGMITHPGAGVRTGTLVNVLIHKFTHLPEGSEVDRPGIVHRLDKDTSGLLLVAKTELVLRKLQEAMQKREITRTYLALVCGHLQENKGTIDIPIGRSSNDRTKMSVTGTRPREAVTHYTLRERYRSYDLLEVSLMTGRTHQIRVHLSHLGHPVFGDPTYGGREKWHRGIFAPERLFAKQLLSIMDRQALHAFRLSFIHPITSEPITIESPTPPDFKMILDLLEKQGC
jgi:23S rRNA pseudouridine1911/1915/1917 synthase